MKELKIKTSRYNYEPIKKPNYKYNIKYGWQCDETGTHPTGENAKWFFMLEETMEVFTKLSIFVTYNAAIAEHSLYPKELKSHVHTKTLHTIAYSRSNS